MSEETSSEKYAPQLLDEKKWWRATFSVFSTKLTHEEISERIGLQPTRTHTKGQPRGARRKDGSVIPSIVWPDSAWHLTSPLGRDRGLDEHIQWLLDAIEPRIEAIDALRADCSLIRLFCGFASHNGQGGFTLDPGTLSRMSRLGLNLNLDLYPPSDPEIIEDKSEGQPTSIVQ